MAEGNKGIAKGNLIERTNNKGSCGRYGNDGGQVFF